MIDEDLRAMERTTATPEERFRFRVACVRVGRPELAGFQVGDRVQVRCAGITFVGSVIRFGEGLAVNGDGRIKTNSSPEFCIQYIHIGEPLDWTLLEPVMP